MLLMLKTEITHNVADEEFENVYYEKIGNYS